MKRPYSYLVLTEQDEELDRADDMPGTLDTVANFGHLRASEWITSGIVDRCVMEIRDRDDRLVRHFLVYVDLKRRAIVRERI